MTRPQFVDVLLGGIVALIAFPLLVGPAAGGWLAARRSERPELPSAFVDASAGVPWAALATLGAVPRVGHHSDLVHVGVNPAPAGVFTLPQGLAVGALALATGAGIAAVGGAFARVTRGRRGNSAAA